MTTTLVVVVAVVCAVTLPGLSRCFVLDGSPSSYAQFRKWCVGVNGSLGLEFRTEEPNGLLMYTDDGGTFDFFELKLVEGALRLRYNLGGGAAIMTVGRNLNDARWHKVTIARRGNETRLGVDDESSTSAVRGPDLIFGNFSTNSDVLLGGLPSEKYATHLPLLALPSAYFEPRFRGAIRNVMFADAHDGLPKRQEFVTYDGVRLSHTDACERHDPCQNGGICISTDKGAYCNCRHVDFEGKHCDKERAPTEATFRGGDFLSYLSAEGAQPIVSTSDDITFSFKTRQAHGLLFFTGDGEHFLNVALKDGGVILTLSLGTAEPMERFVKPQRIRFDDNQWHKVAVHREVREISGTSSFCDFLVTVDDIYKDNGITAGIFTLLSSSVMYIGGSENVAKLPGSRIKTNFVGCLRKVEFKADSLSLNLLELGRTSNKMINVHGKVDFMCQEVGAADPVTFTTSESYLALPNWEATRQGSISFKLRTTEANGLLMYNSGALAAGGDFFAFELLDGHVFLILNLGSGAARVKASGNRRLDDGQWHSVSLRRTGRNGRVSVDESAADFSTPGDSNQLDLAGSLYVGGIGPGVGYEGNQVAVPSDLWTGPLGLGFVGCLRDLVVNGKAMDIATYARHQDSGSVRSSCHTLGRQCDSQPCMNGGICSEGWNRFVCDCKETGFLGQTCGKDATTLSFDGEQYVRVTMTEVSRTQAEDISIRFHTNRPSGLILLTKSNRTSDRLELAVEGGRTRFTLNLGDGEKVLFAGHGLNDNQWHTLRISRRGRSMKMRVDDELHVIDEYPGKHTILEVQQLHIGLARFQSTSPSSTSPSAPTSNVHSFVGHMQRFILNGQAYFDLARSGQAPHVEITAVFGKRENIVHHPVTFKSKKTFVSLPRLNAYATMNVYFQFKTIEMNGLILFNGGVGQDFIAIELADGHLHFVFNLGDGPRRVRSNTRAPLNDNRWHAVTIARPTLHQHTLIVDDMIATVTITGSNMHLDLDGLLYLGGVSQDMYPKLPKLVQSKHGFEGCIASLDLNGDTPDPSSDAILSSNLVLPGCDGPSTKCSFNACSNSGACIQQWNGYTCNCDMTTFNGPTCADESLAYDFYRSVPGLITFNFPSDKRPETKGDLLAIGFATDKHDAVLFRVDSDGTNDYMELGIVEGNVLMMYNMGTEDHALGELGVRVNDGEYHVVRFTRSGSNATIQVDDYNVQAKHPGGKQLSVFNSQAKIQVGGKKNPLKGIIERPFKGTLAGLSFNGLRVLDLVAEHDSRVTVEGNVAVRVSMASLIGPKMARLAEHHPGNLMAVSGSETPLPQMQRTPAIAGIGKDELVFSGSGCGAEDDEDCSSPLETGSGDDLITPVYIPPTPKPRKPTTSPAPVARTPKTPGGPCDEDDEDCQEGSSGAGEVGTLLATSSPQPLTPSFTVPPPSLTHQPPYDPEETLLPNPTPIPGGTNFRYPPSPTPHFGYEDHDADVNHSLDTDGVYNPVTPTPYRPVKSDNTRDPYDTARTNLGTVTGTGSSSGTSTSDSVALIIGIIAGILCGVVIVILLVCCCCRPSEGSYKVDESKNYQFAATGPGGHGGSPGGGGGGVGGAMGHGVSPGVMVGGVGVPGGVGMGLGCGVPPPGVGFINGQQLQMNGNVKMGEKAGKIPKKKEMKDIKEWYV